jgi:hypothetical protein
MAAVIVAKIGRGRKGSSGQASLSGIYSIRAWTSTVGCGAVTIAEAKIPTPRTG